MNADTELAVEAAPELAAPQRRARPVRTALEKTFVSHDGTELFYRHWPAPANAVARRAVLLLHRGHEHSGRLAHIVDELGLDDVDMFAWDARGHGRSPGARGDAPSFGACVKDLDAFVRHIEARYYISPEDMAIVAQSMAAVVAATWVHDYAPRLRALVLTAPAFSVKLYVPLARPGLRLLHRLRGNFFINSYVKPRLLTHDPERIRSYGTDPLVTRAISVRVLLGLLDTAERIVADAATMHVPVLLLLSDTDWVVHRSPQERFFARLGSAVKEMRVLRGFLHDTLGERDRRQALDAAREFIARQFSGAYERHSRLDADETGHTFAEEQALRRALPALCWRNANFALTRLAMRTLGRLSDGIRIGLEHGFDSGAMLDYVYRNRAGGRLGVGRIIDRGFLDAIGWRGIRVRKQHVARAIAHAAAQLRAAGRPVRILDVAAGPGTYVLDVARALPEPPAAIVLRDYDEANVRRAREAIECSGLAAIARAERADAFDPATLHALDPRPNVVIVSGLYELYAANAPVLGSLAAIAGAIEPGGYLVYTGQPWHPQLELIARTLVNHRDRGPWIMRRRSQAELDELVRHAGFVKREQWIDDWGIFTVSLAMLTPRA